MGRALLWWPFTAFLMVAAFPAIAVPAMVGSGVALILVGLVGGVLGRLWRTHKLRRAGRTIGTPATGTSTPPAIPSDAAAGDEPDGEGPGVRAA